jgi:tetratricopeptide (TPR) repeat protein
MIRTLTLFFIFTVVVASADPGALMKKGDAYDAEFNAQKALECFLEVEKAIPANAALKVKIARQYVFRMRDLSSKTAQIESAQTALRYAEEAVKLAPKSSDAHLSIAICLGKLTPLLGNKEMIEASQRIKTSAEKAVALNPKSDLAWHLLGRWHQGVAGIGGMTRALASVVYGTMPQGSNEEAIRCFKKALEINPLRLIHHVELGRTYSQAGEPDLARKFLKAGLAMPNQDFDDPETKQRGRTALAELGES